MAKKIILSQEELNISINAVRDAVEFFGSQVSLAKATNDLQQHISSYLNGKRLVPIHRAIQIEVATKGKVKRSRLRPDIF